MFGRLRLLILSSVKHDSSLSDAASGVFDRPDDRDESPVRGVDTRISGTDIARFPGSCRLVADATEFLRRDEVEEADDDGAPSFESLDPDLAESMLPLRENFETKRAANSSAVLRPCPSL